MTGIEFEIESHCSPAALPVQAVLENVACVFVCLLDYLFLVVRKLVCLSKRFNLG